MGEELHKWVIVVLVNDLALFKCLQYLISQQLVSPDFTCWGYLHVFSCWWPSPAWLWPQSSPRGDLPSWGGKLHFLC